MLLLPEHYTTNFFGKYPGFSIFQTKPTNNDFQFIIGNMENGLSGWKTKMLSIASRLIVTKSTLSSIPSHIMQFIKIPKKINKTINKIYKNFIWGSTIDKKKLYLLSWERISITKAMGGLASKKVR